MNLVCEDNAAVGLAVAIVVVERQDGVLEFLIGMPVRIGRPDGDPEVAVCVNR